MAKIIHTYTNDTVYDECNDRGTTFWDFVNKWVHHYRCSKCKKEVPSTAKFCPECGEKFIGNIKEG